MTNKDKFLKDGVSEYDFTEFVFNNGNIYCEAGKADECYIKKLDLLHLLQQPVKPTLTEDERVILRNVQLRAFSSYRVIGKDNHNQLYLADTSKAIDKFYGFGQYFGHLFKSIKERRRILY